METLDERKGNGSDEILQVGDLRECQRTPSTHRSHKVIKSRETVRFITDGQYCTTSLKMGVEKTSLTIDASHKHV